METKEDFKKELRSFEEANEKGHLTSIGIVRLEILREVKNLILAEVSRMFTCEFAEYIAEEHYRLHNVEKGKHYWKSEEGVKTTKQLLKDFKKTFKK